MEHAQLPYVLSPGKGGIDVIFNISPEGQNTIVDNIQIEGATARKLNLPANPGFGKNNDGEAAFYQCSVNRGENIFMRIRQKIISARMKKMEETVILL